MLHHNESLEKLYEYIADDEDSRVCTDIAESACRVVPGNFFTILVANSLTKLGDELCNAKTILPWLLTLVQAPQFLLGLLVPVRESGSLLPQLVIAAFVRRLGQRKWVWIIGSVLQSLSVALMAVAATSLTGATAGVAIMSALVIFSLARGMCSVAHKDVIGKTIPKSRRGRLAGLSGSVAGIIAVVTGISFVAFNFQTATITTVAILLGAASLSWLIAGVVFATIREHAGATEGGGNAIDTAVKSFKILFSDHQFRLFVGVRSLLLCSALTAPYIIQLGTIQSSNSLSSLGLFIVANGLASTVSSPFWGKFADLSSRRVMILSALVAAALGLIVFTISQLFADLTSQPLLYPAAFFILAIAHNGVRLGRKTYLVDMAGGNKRTEYVAVSNTVMGVILLLAGLLIGLLGSISVPLVILTLSLAGLAAAALATRLDEV